MTGSLSGRILFLYRFSYSTSVIFYPIARFAGATDNEEAELNAQFSLTTRERRRYFVSVTNAFRMSGFSSDIHT